MNIPFETLWDLVGRRTDDPIVRAFHESFGLSVPTMLTAKVAYSGPVSDKLDVHYHGALRTRATWPPLRVAGKYVGYVRTVLIHLEYPGPLPAGVTLQLSLDDAMAQAVETRATPGLELVVLRKDDRRELIFAFHRKNKTLVEARISPVELEQDDPILVELEASVKTERAPRVIPAPAPRPTFPGPLRRLAQMRGAVGLREDGIDLHLYEDWQCGGAESWTGNPAAELELSVFGQDGTGGLVAFWLVEPGSIAEQPVVFLGSDGEVGAVASSLAEFVQLIAQGVGPLEAVEYGKNRGTTIEDVVALARELTGTEPESSVEILARAIDRYGDIEERMRTLNLW